MIGLGSDKNEIDFYRSFFSNNEILLKGEREHTRPDQLFLLILFSFYNFKLKWDLIERREKTRARECRKRGRLYLRSSSWSSIIVINILRGSSRSMVITNVFFYQTQHRREIIDLLIQMFETDATVPLKWFYLRNAGQKRNATNQTLLGFVVKGGGL